MDVSLNSISPLALLMTLTRMPAQGQKEYNPNQGLYHFNIYDFEADNATYAAWLSEVEADVDRVAELSKNYDLSINLLIWGSYQHFETTSGHGGHLQNQMVSFDADPAYILWTDIVHGRLGVSK